MANAELDASVWWIHCQALQQSHGLTFGSARRYESPRLKSWMIVSSAKCKRTANIPSKCIN